MKAKTLRAAALMCRKIFEHVPERQCLFVLDGRATAQALRLHKRGVPLARAAQVAAVMEEARNGTGNPGT